MKIIRLTLSVCTVFILCMAGCASTGHQVQEASVRQKKTAVSPESTSSYYWYTEAELSLKKGNNALALQQMEKAAAFDPDSIYVKKELTALYIKNNEINKAFETANQILILDPNNIEGLIMKAGILQIINQADGYDRNEVKEIYERVISLDPERRNIYRILAGLYMEDNEDVDALRILNTLILKFPDDYSGYFFIGRILVQQNKPVQAEKNFLKTLDIEPKLIEPRFELAEIYKNQGKTDKAIQTYKDILSIYPDNIRASFELGLTYLASGRKNKSDSVFKNLGERSETDSLVIKQMLKLYVENKEYKKAVAIIDGMIKGVKDPAELHYIAGITSDSGNDAETAIKHFKEIPPDSKFYNKAVVHMAYIYRKEGNIDKAIDIVSQAREKDPENYDFINYLGSFYEEAKMYDKAANVFQEGLELDKSNTVLLFRLGVVYDKWGKKELSIEKMKQLIAIDPENSNALNYLGYTYADMGQNLDEAEALIKKALAGKPDDGYITDSLGWVYYQKGEYEKALPVLERAAELVQDDPLILEHLGDAYLKMGMEKDALESYRRSLKLNKDGDTENLKQKINTLTEMEK